MSKAYDPENDDSADAVDDFEDQLNIEGIDDELDEDDDLINLDETCSYCGEPFDEAGSCGTEGCPNNIEADA